jgi:hypothetical protein
MTGALARHLLTDHESQRGGRARLTGHAPQLRDRPAQSVGSLLGQLGSLRMFAAK